MNCRTFPTPRSKAEIRYMKGANCAQGAPYVEACPTPTSPVCTAKTNFLNVGPNVPYMGCPFTETEGCATCETTTITTFQ